MGLACDERRGAALGSRRGQKVPVVVGDVGKWGCEGRSQWEPARACCSFSASARRSAKSSSRRGPDTWRKRRRCAEFSGQEPRIEEGRWRGAGAGAWGVLPRERGDECPHHFRLELLVGAAAW